MHSCACFVVALEKGEEYNHSIVAKFCQLVLTNRLKSGILEYVVIVGPEVRAHLHEFRRHFFRGLHDAISPKSRALPRTQSAGPRRV